jgi:hypothetical protein
MEQQQIDQYLERYLVLLDEYTQLRRDLSGLQSQVYQNIARANFTAERGMRYGQDHYDDRMQSILSLKITPSAAGVPVYVLEKPPVAAPAADHKVKEDQDTDSVTEEKAESGTTADKKSAQKSKDPLRWFGLLTPAPLRTAQAQSLRAVEHIIPRLVTVNAEMASLEIEVRRVRKRRAKAEAATLKAAERTATPEAQAKMASVESN